MTVIVTKLRPTSEEKDPSNSNSSRLALSSNGTPPQFPEDNSKPTTFHPIYQSSFKNITTSLSLVISKKSESAGQEHCVKKCTSIPGFRSDLKVVSRGRRRSVDKQYRPSQPTGNNNGGGRTSSRRSGRSYQNYDNNSSNGNSGADGNGEDNDDSDDDEDDEYIDDDDDEEEEEEEDDEEDDDDKNEDDDDDEQQEKNNGVDNSIDDKVLASFGLKVPGDSTVNLEDAENVGNGPIPPGTPITLQGIVCHETVGGVLVVNIKWRNKIYCGSLMDCTRHSWARPRFQATDGGAHPGKTRMGKGIVHGKGKGKGKRLRSNSVTSTNSNNHTVSPLKQKLRGRKKTISGSSVEKRQGFRSSKRKPKNDDDSDDSLRPGKRTCTVKGAPSPTPSPILIPCPEPGCEKKYKHINGLRYHQAHAHLESKNQDEDNNSDDRSSTTPSPSEEFKEPDPLTAVKSRTSSITTRSLGESSSSGNSFNSIEKEENNNTDNSIKTPAVTESANIEQIVSEPKQQSDECEDTAGQPTENSFDIKEERDVQNIEQDGIKEESKNDSTFVEVADKSTDTCIATTVPTCNKHSVITPVVPANEVPEVADTQEIWETVIDSGCVSSETSKNDVSTKLDKQDNSKGTKSEGQQVMITTCGINQLGIEVEDISENEEDIDPGQDIEFNSREEMEKAVENLQSGSFVASLSTETNLQMLSSLKDPSLIFGLTNRDRIADEKESSDGTDTEAVVSMENNTSKKSENTAESTKVVSPSNVLPCTISVETLVSRSITASKHEPPLTNADTPSSRFKYFPCRSYGDESYSIASINNTNTTTLSLIRDPELIKNDTNNEVSVFNANTAAESSAESTKPSYTGSSGFNQDCTTSSIHSHGPKEELKEQSSVGDIIKSHTTVTSEQHSSGHPSSSYTSPKSLTTTTYNTKVCSSQLDIEIPNTSSDTKSRRTNNLGNIENENSNKPRDCGSSYEEKKSDESEKSPVLFARQPPNLIPKHSRPSVPTLPVGVAYPYQYTSMVSNSSGPATTSHPDIPQSDVTKSDDGDIRSGGREKPIGEVGPVSVKRPAIHAGLPTVIPVGAPGLKTQASLPIRQGLKPHEERASTPNSLRLPAASPRTSTTSPLPTSPRLSDLKSSKHTSNSPQSKTSNTIADVVIVKQESEPSGSKVAREIEREKKASSYEIPTEHLTHAEQLQLYELHQRRFLLAQQANMDPLTRLAYFRNVGYDLHWPLPVHQQQQRLRAVEEERMELQAARRSKDESSSMKVDSNSTMASAPPSFQRSMKDLSPSEGSRSITSTSETTSRGMVCLDQPPEKKTKVELAKSDEADPDLQKLRLKRQEDYLYKQSMQHKFTMFKQLENAGGAAKTHSIPPMLDDKEDSQKTKYLSTSAHTESANQTFDKSRKTTNDGDESSQLELSTRTRDPLRDIHSKTKRIVPTERGSFIPSQFQEYLKHDQLLERYENSQPGNALLIPGHLDASYVSSRMKDRDSNSPYKSPSPRPSLPRSPSSSLRTSPYKSDRASSSQSISPHRLPRSSYSDAYSFSSASSSRSSVFSRADKPKSPPHPSERHKSEVYSSSSPSSSRMSLTDAPSRAPREDSPKHGGYRERIKEDVVRPGIISNNLAVRRGDVTASMVMQGRSPADEELLRRHSYMVYPPYRDVMEHRQQQRAEQVYAMMSSAHQSAARSEQYYNKRQ